MQNTAYSDAKLIELVKRQPAVWCKLDSLYHNRIADKTIWKEISDLLESDVNFLKKRWHTLRGQYRRETRTYGRNSKWKHFKRMRFIDFSAEPKPSPACTENEDEDDPIHIEPPQPEPLAPQNIPSIPMKEEPCDWSSSSSESPKGEKTAPKVMVDVSNESNYYFALSLIGILNAIPKECGLSARIAVLNALKDFQPVHTANV
uniref:MADF domain-containing protein n=1 Tax=Anopheles minimus TaxID=112268 RepID=A0A182VZQ6_9DIPT